LVCDKDSVVLPAQGEELARRVPQAQLHRIDGLGHLGHEEHPRWFVDQVNALAKAQGL
jgi:magnesium chelatase accessory protein